MGGWHCECGKAFCVTKEKWKSGLKPSDQLAVDNPPTNDSKSLFTSSFESLAPEGGGDMPMMNKVKGDKSALDRTQRLHQQLRSVLREKRRRRRTAADAFTAAADAVYGRTTHFSYHTVGIGSDAEEGKGEGGGGTKSQCKRMA